MNDLIIDTIAIRRDAAGRYSLNDLHRAAGGEGRHQPSNFMRLDATNDLVNELTQSSDVRIAEHVPAFRVALGGMDPGTYVVKELVYSYAMWISARFSLAVIRAYDSLVTSAVSVPQTLPEALRLAADLAERNEALSSTIAIQAPKVEALERLSEADGAMCVTSAAKSLQVKPKDLFQWLEAHRWMFRRQGTSWQAYQDKLDAGVLKHKVTTIRVDNGPDRVQTQVLVTAKGLTALAEHASEKPLKTPKVDYKPRRTPDAVLKHVMAVDVPGEIAQCNAVLNGGGT